jgi:dihydroorotase
LATLIYLEKVSLLKVCAINSSTVSKREWKRIDPHVHFRGFGEKQKSTIGQGMELARSQGVVAVIDMPNTKPPIIDHQTVEARFAEARSEGCTKGYYIYIGATANEDQIRNAARLAKNHPGIAGIKMYAGKSTNPGISIIEEHAQRMVYRILAEEGYTGVLAVHCEKESLSHYDLWRPDIPAIWNSVKPPESEVESVRDQIRFAREEGFKGHLHICHTSVPESVDLVNEAKKSGMSISCCATPHHVTYCIEDDMLTPDGTRLKVNPPIRERVMMVGLRNKLRSGEIDLIETDHAPHELENKIYRIDKPKESYASGIRSLEGYNDFLNRLIDIHGFSQKQLEDLTYWNIKRIFPKIRE